MDQRVVFSILRTMNLLILVPIIWYISSCESEEAEPSKIELPSAKFIAEDTVVIKGSAVKFENQSQNADSHAWYFGDGESSTEINPVHTYPNSGSYTVNLVVANDNGKDSCTSLIIVKENEIIVMSYNIAISGGAIPLVLDIAKSNGHEAYLNNRMPEILSIIRAADPDILGLQEALLWDSFEPAYYLRIADSLGMRYFYYPEYSEAEWNGICIYSKFPLVPLKKIFHQPCVPDFEWNGLCLLGVKIEVDSTSIFDFFCCHLMSQVEGSNKCEMETIHDFLLDDFNPLTILLGDMNWHKNEYRSGLFVDAGLSYVDPRKLPTGYPENNPVNIDQIWVSNELHNGSRSCDRWTCDEYFNPTIEAMLRDASDHLPVVARLLY